VNVVFTAATYLGIVALVGAGATRRWPAVAASAVRGRRRVISGAVIGCLLLLVGSHGEIVDTILRILRGRFDTDLYLGYLVETRHGRATLLRSGLAGLLLLASLRGLRPARLDRALFVLASLLLLATIAWVSHSGTMGPLPFIVDLAHLTATTAWAGALAYLAWLPLWRPGPELTLAVAQTSRVGLAAVTALVASGSVLATLHVYGIGALRETAYGRSLVAKLAVVALVLVLAAANRWLFVPLLERHARSAPLRRSVRIESLLLAGVLIATAVLTTREPAHVPPQADGVPPLSAPADGEAGPPADGHGDGH
jgi:putative copper export protein